MDFIAFYLEIWLFKKTGINFLDQSNNEVKPNILSKINLVWCQLLCNIFKRLKIQSMNLIILTACRSFKWSILWN